MRSGDVKSGDVKSGDVRGGDVKSGGVSEAANREERGQATGLLSGFLERTRNRRAAALIPDGSRVLDIGCGRAGLLRALSALGRSVDYTGADITESVIQRNRAEYPEACFLVIGPNGEGLWPVDDDDAANRLTADERREQDQHDATKPAKPAAKPNEPTTASCRLNADERREQDQHRTTKPAKPDVIALIALVEHLGDASSFVSGLATLLAPGGKIVMTAPRRGAEGVYALGSRLGIFSREAHEEHNDAFPDRENLERLARESGLRLTLYQRFLFGFNQLAVMER